MSAQNVGDVFQAFLDQVNRKRWDEARKYVQPTLTYNDDEASGDVFIGTLSADLERQNVSRVALDALTVDHAGPKLAARSIAYAETPEGTKIASWSLVIVFFADNRISRFYQIFHRDLPGLPPTPLENPPPNQKSETPLSAEEMETTYLDYITSYNRGGHKSAIERSWAEEVTMNGFKSPTAATPDIISQFLLPVIAGLDYGVEESVVDVERQQIAVRLSLRGVAKNPNLQKKGAEGEEVTHYEHALYTFLEGKISGGWAVQEFDMSPPPR
ncbi:hypothetical protein Cob_v008664 [Colletotrichum orbiculare MAFF 240422]|uniref:SnoaL-like polyketide cyclase n=1 Tax=Colletotrichum orbiculare (strain 104-T / ATCC 96160 / CBS 514.97 / LARS 414 / MAFF 240422) TaxID=1213857 RepID=A0A484FKX4_COLOR|nr:hypothetical protein Cob_v008664 [Colletotrichum orbiculare MAFF 240422]